MKILIALVLLVSCASNQTSTFKGLTPFQIDTYFDVLEEADLLRCEHTPHDNYQFLSYTDEDLTAADIEAIDNALPADAGISMGSTGFEVDMNIANEACQ